MSRINGCYAQHEVFRSACARQKKSPPLRQSFQSFPLKLHMSACCGRKDEVLTEVYSEGKSDFFGLCQMVAGKLLLRFAN